MKKMDANFLTLKLLHQNGGIVENILAMLRPMRKNHL